MAGTKTTFDPTIGSEPIRVLIASNRLPENALYGGDQVVLELIEFLANEGIMIEFLTLNSNFSHRPWMKLARELTACCKVRARGNLRLGRYLVRTSPFAWTLYIEEGIMKRLPNSTSALAARILPNLRLENKFKVSAPKGPSDVPDDSDASFISRRVAKLRPNALIVNYTWLGSLFSRVGNLSGVLKIVFGHELLHVRAASFKQAGIQLDFPDWDQQTEIDNLRGADIVLLETPEEAEVLGRAAPDTLVLCTPRGLPFRKRGEMRMRGRCLFVGSDALANRSGLRWLLTDVWPIVLDRVPSATLEVCGRVCEFFAGEEYPGVHFAGRVDSLFPSYDVACVCVIPLLAGTGFKTKLIEALSYGCACVSTPVGAAGAEATIGEAVLVAQSAPAFADAVSIVLVNDERRVAMEGAAESYARKNLSQNATLRPVLDLILGNRVLA